MPGTSFDQVADVYDATRGGDRRGTRFADALSGWIVGPRVVELGVGTGAVAAGLRRLGVPVVGVDLSEAMLRRALGRIGPSVAMADVDELPLADDSVDTAYLVWVLQLVEEPFASLAEAARVVRPGGRVVTILSNADDHPDDEIAAVLRGLAPLRRHRHGRDPIVADAPPGVRLAHDGHTPWDEFETTPAEQIDMIEKRLWSSLFDVDDATWADVVDPVLARLRALPEPERPRVRRNRHPLVVWTVRHV